MADQGDQDRLYQEARRKVEARKGFYAHAFVFVVLNVIFLIVVGRDFLWATAFWGLGLIAHGFNVFVSGSQWLRDWEDRAVEREVSRQHRAGQPPPPPPPPDATATQSEATETIERPSD